MSVTTNPGAFTFLLLLFQKFPPSTFSFYFTIFLFFLCFVWWLLMLVFEVCCCCCCLLNGKEKCLLNIKDLTKLLFKAVIFIDINLSIIILMFTLYKKIYSSLYDCNIIVLCFIEFFCNFLLTIFFCSLSLENSISLSLPLTFFFVVFHKTLITY